MYTRRNLKQIHENDITYFDNDQSPASIEVQLMDLCGCGYANDTQYFGCQYQMICIQTPPPLRRNVRSRTL